MGNSKSSSKQNGGANHNVSDHDRAVLDLKVARDELKQYQKKTQSTMDRHTQVARELLKKGDKKNALLVVKRKKIAQAALDSAAAKLDNVQQLIDQIESAKINVQIFESLKQGNAALKELNSLVSVADVEALLEETAEQSQIAKELDDALSGHVLSAEDEAALEDEYNQLLESSALETGQELPSVPLATPEGHDVPAATSKTASKQKKALVAE